MALMVGNGAQAGALSRFAPTGIIVNKNMLDIGLGGHETQTYLNNLLAHAVVTFVAYFLFGGWRLFTRGPVAQPEMAQSDQVGARAEAEVVDVEPFTAAHWLTMARAGDAGGGGDLVQGARRHGGADRRRDAVAVGAANEKDAIRKMPWGVILMVCGVTVLIGVLSAQRGMELFTEMLATISTPGTVTFTIALVTGAVSVYSSTSGVVLPAFLPTVPGLAARLGADPMAIASRCTWAGTSSICRRSPPSARCASRRCRTKPTRRSCSTSCWRGGCR